MSGLIDISVRLHAGMPIWPGSTGFRMEMAQSFDTGADVNVSRIDMDVHCGTHVEAPLHFIDGGSALEEYALETFVGVAHVVDMRGTSAIGAAELESASLPSDMDRLLIRTSNSDKWGWAAEFDPGFVALTLDGAEWIAERGIKVVGVDYLSVQRFVDGPETHRVLMRAGVAILEGIDLHDVAPGRYRLTCLPIWLARSEAAPARAILEPLP
jgi:arylformamidase